MLRDIPQDYLSLDERMLIEPELGSEHWDALWEEWLRRHEERLRRRIMKLAKPMVDVEVVLNEVIVTILFNIWQRKFEYQRKPLIHYAYRVAFNVTQAANRDVSRHISLDVMDWRTPTGSDVYGRHPERIVLRREEHRSLWQAVKGLPPKDRRVIYARYREGKPYKRIAAQVGMSEAAARQIHRRALKRLRNKVQRDRV